MVKKIFSLIALFLGAFLLFSPQTSWAISCKCTAPSSVGTVQINCQTFPTEYAGDSIKDCEQHKPTIANRWNESGGQLITADSMTCETFDDDSCTNPLPPGTITIDPDLPFIDSYTVDLNKKPLLEVNIPGLNFSDVAKSTDDTGTYLYIAWIPELITSLYKFLLAIVSIVAAVVIVIQGVRVIGSGGGEGKTTAYKKIFQAIVGLFIAWGSYAILYNINPALVQFNALKVKVVDRQNLPDFVEMQNTTAETVSPEDANEVVNDTPKFENCPITLTNPLENKTAGTANKEKRTAEFYEKIGSVITGSSQTDRILQVADAATKCGVRFGSCGRTAGTIYTLAGVVTEDYPQTCLNTNDGCKTQENTKTIFSWPTKINTFSRSMSGCEAICADKTKKTECAASRVASTKLVMDALVSSLTEKKLTEEINKLQPGDAFWIYNANGEVCRGNHAMIFDKWGPNGNAQVIQGMNQQSQNMSKKYSDGQVVYGYICLKAECGSKRKPLSRIFRPK